MPHETVSDRLGFYPCLFSILAKYDRDDPAQGDFADTFVARDNEEAEEACRRVMAENLGYSEEDDPEGFAAAMKDVEIVEVTAGVNAWMANDLAKALERVLNMPELNDDALLSKESRAVVEEVQRTLDRATGKDAIEAYLAEEAERAGDEEDEGLTPRM